MLSKSMRLVASNSFSKRFFNRSFGTKKYKDNKYKFPFNPFMLYDTKKI